MKPVVKLLFVTSLSLGLFCSTAIAFDDPGGIVFRSYESSPDSRTSISVPSSEGGIIFHKELHVSFDNRIDAERENFGYICRIIVDRTSSVDIILVNRIHDLPRIGVVASCSETPEFFPIVDSLYEWHNVDISFTCAVGGGRFGACGQRDLYRPYSFRQTETRGEASFRGE